LGSPPIFARRTRRLREALQLVDIRVLDHMMVADHGCLSFAERRLM
jgi:DNA repair protein RadC